MTSTDLKERLGDMIIDQLLDEINVDYDYEKMLHTVQVRNKQLNYEPIAWFQDEDDAEFFRLSLINNIINT